ncbi:hypothetical protein Peur_064617 [Populus x canadensis]|jgi:hypothetical protein
MLLLASLFFLLKYTAIGKATRSHTRGHASPIGQLISMAELGKLLLTQQPSLYSHAHHFCTQQPSLSIHMLITSVPSNLNVESEEMKLALPINEVDDGFVNLAEVRGASWRVDGVRER